MRALNAERSTYPNSKSHRLTDSTFPILKLFHVELSEQMAGPKQQKEYIIHDVTEKYLNYYWHKYDPRKSVSDNLIDTKYPCKNILY